MKFLIRTIEIIIFIIGDIGGSNLKFTSIMESRIMLFTAHFVLLYLSFCIHFREISF